MTELFRSALSYLSQTAPSGTAVIGKLDHPLVGTNVEIARSRFKVRSLIAEGGYALVFSAQDVHGNWFALKRQLAADREAAEAVLKEIRFLKELNGHPAILRYVQAAQLSPQESGHGRAEFLLLTELCPGGVIELIQKGPLTVRQIAKIFYAACSAINHMHSKKPPVIHRDMKIENLLFDVSGRVKLCDFGSATTEIIIPNETWSALRRTQLEEELARHTTPMYRAPELLDMYSNFPLGPAQDIWALGCVLYYLCYRKHPFEDSAKLRIINAKYSLPDVDSGYVVWHPFIQAALQVDPRERPQASVICKKIETLGETLSIDFSEPVEGLELPQLFAVTPSQNQLQTEISVCESEKSPNLVRKSPSTPRKSDYEQTAQQASAVLGAIKGQGMSWLKNIKDRTAAVAQTVQSTYGNRGPDITYITSRLVIAPLADNVPETLAAQAEETMRAHVMDQAKGQFAAYNLSHRHLRCDYGSRLSETPLPPVGSGLTPTVKFLLNLCKNMATFLKQKETNAVLITGPEIQCVLVAAALLLYSRLVSRPLSALELICSKRQPINLPPSYHRQLDLITTTVFTSPSELLKIVHNKPVILQTLLISPVPQFNRARTGCRPFVEIHAGGTKLWSTYKKYEELKSFESSEQQMVVLPLGDIPVADDVQIAIYHARWLKMQNRMQQHLMFSLSFHANFINPNTRMLELNRGDLDHQADDDSKFGEPLRVGLQMKIGEHDRGFSAREPPAVLSYDLRDVPRVLLVSGLEEFDTIMEHLGINQRKQPSRKNPPLRPPPPHSQIYNEQNKLLEEKQKFSDGAASPSSKDSFFSTLQWQDDSNSGQKAFHDGAFLDTFQMNSVSVRSSQQIPQYPSLIEPQIESNRDKSGSAELCERLCGIRVNGENEGVDGDRYKFDHEKVFDNMKQEAVELASAVNDADLLNLGSGCDVVNCSSNQNHTANGLKYGCVSLFSNTSVQEDLQFDAVFEVPNETSDTNLLVDFKESDICKGGMQRNLSAPIFSNMEFMASTSEAGFDPFAEFLASTKDFTVPASKSAKSKNLENAFDDLLTSQGFQSSTKIVKSLGEMRRQEEIKEMDPVMIKVRDWTKGKERNIRALLGSLSDILWSDADSWVQPSIGDLLTAQQVKKYYRKACLVVHPDKQVGTKNEALARAVFTELNDAWTAFENAGSPSL